MRGHLSSGMELVWLPVAIILKSELMQSIGDLTMTMHLWH